MHIKLKLFSFLVLLLVVYPEPATAKTTARQVATKYLAVLEQRNYKAVVEIVDSRAISQYRSEFSFLKDAPGSFKDEIYFLHFGETEKVINAMSDKEFYFSLLKTTTEAAISSGQNATNYKNAKYVGEVKEGDYQHLLFRRVNFELGDNSHTIEVLTMRKINGQWKTSISQHMKAVLTNLRNALKK